jgi:mannosyltransferase
MMSQLGGRLSRVKDGGRQELVMLTAVTLIALTLRLYKLGDWSFWLDEIYTVVGSRDIGYWALPRLPIYLVLTNVAVNTWGANEWSARLIPALIGSLTVPLLFFPTRRIWGTGVALIAALLLAVSPWHIFWSQNARFYTLLLLFYNAGLLLLFIGLEKRRFWLILAGLFLLGLAIRERELGLMFAPVLAVYVLMLLLLPFTKPAWLRLPYLAPTLLPVAVFLGYDLYSYTQTGISYVRTFFLFLVGNPIDSPIRILILIFFSIGLPVVVLGLFSGGWLIWERSHAGLFFLVSAAVPILLLISVSPWVFVVERYALITLPAWLTLTAVAVERLLTWLPRQGTWLAGGVLSLLLVHAMGDHLAYYALNNGNRLDWRGAYHYIAERKAPDDLVASDRPEIGSYYLDENQTVIDLKAIKIEELAAIEQPVWFVVDSHGIWAVPPENRAWLENNAELLFVWYLRVREQIDLKVYRYGHNSPGG